MEHEHMTYPEALRWLAKKYNIEIVEKELTPEQMEAASKRESLFVVNGFAEQYFVDQLTEVEGSKIGKTYFTERGYTEDIISQFKLGYSPKDRESFLTAARDGGYKDEFLLELGLVKSNDKGLYDAYGGRVIFPIHDLSGRCLGFAGRTLRSDKNIPKYVNSPESEIYHKSNVLYGLFYAKNEIIRNDLCYIVEGYTDVISLYQSGVKNVVSSSGTSLTEGQIRLIKRYTNNVVLLFDGDAAGVKASMRGINLVLKEGLNVKLILLPDGEDPDSFSKSNSPEALHDFLAQNAQDFLHFKAHQLLEEQTNDPVKRVQAIKDMVESISVIPDNLARSIYTKDCAAILGVEERVLVLEINKLRRKQYYQKHQISRTEQDFYEPIESPPAQPPPPKKNDTYYQERDLLRIIFNYPDLHLEFKKEDGESVEITPLQFILLELSRDKLEFDDPLHRDLFNEIVLTLESEESIDINVFINHEREDIRTLVVDLISTRYDLHDWDRKNIRVQLESDKIMRSVRSSVFSFKERKVEQMIEAVQEELRQAYDNDADVMDMLKRKKRLDLIKSSIGGALGRVIVK